MKLYAEYIITPFCHLKTTAFCFIPTFSRNMYQLMFPMKTIDTYENHCLYLLSPHQELSVTYLHERKCCKMPRIIFINSANFFFHLTVLKLAKSWLIRSCIVAKYSSEGQLPPLSLRSLLPLRSLLQLRSLQLQL